jgi:hypothetical protein
MQMNEKSDINTPLTLNPIQTYWNGLHFRSRLEARWAVFYDRLGIRYEYEKEGYDLGNGIWYLPDFWLPEQRCFVEIKPQMYGSGNRSKRSDAYLRCGRLARQSGHKVYLFSGSIGNVISDVLAPLENYPPIFMSFSGNRDAEYENIDCPEYYEFDSGFWAKCRKCGFVLEHADGNHCPDQSLQPWHDELLIAYRIARAIRFEEVHKPEWKTFIDEFGRTQAKRIENGITNNSRSSDTTQPVQVSAVVD